MLDAFGNNGAHLVGATLYSAIHGDRPKCRDWFCTKVMPAP
jgi:hypothetical protein